MMTIDAEQAIAELNAIAVRLANMTPFLQSVGNTQAGAIHARIQRSKTAPMGGNWAPWRPRTEAARIKKGNAQQGLLWDSGALLNSFVVETGPDAVTIGTPVSYAVYLQDGTERMAAREFMGWSETDVSAVELLGIAYIEGIGV